MARDVRGVAGAVTRGTRLSIIVRMVLLMVGFDNGCATLVARRTMWVSGLSMTKGFGAEQYQSMTCGDILFRGRPNDILPPTLIHSHTHQSYPSFATVCLPEQSQWELSQFMHPVAR